RIIKWTNVTQNQSSNWYTPNRPIYALFYRYVCYFLYAAELSQDLSDKTVKERFRQAKQEYVSSMKQCDTYYQQSLLQPEKRFHVREWIGDGTGIAQLKDGKQSGMAIFDGSIEDPDKEYYWISHKSSKYKPCVMMYHTLPLFV